MAFPRHGGPERMLYKPFRQLLTSSPVHIGRDRRDRESYRSLAVPPAVRADVDVCDANDVFETTAISLFTSSLV
jgi:hypothetical protein